MAELRLNRSRQSPERRLRPASPAHSRRHRSGDLEPDHFFGSNECAVSSTGHLSVSHPARLDNHDTGQSWPRRKCNSLIRPQPDLCSHRCSEQRCGHHSPDESQCRAKPILPRLAERYELAGMRLLATKDWTSLVVRCLTLTDLRIPRHATSSASDRTLQPTRPATHKMSPLSARTSSAAETAESTHHASCHLHDAPSFTPSVRLMKTQTATEWGRFLQWL